MDGVGEVASDIRTGPTHRLLVINIDRTWDFTTQWRRQCLDLYRLRPTVDGEPPLAETATEVDAWDVVGNDTSGRAEFTRERDLARIWRYWPRRIIGGADAAAAELEDMLTLELTRGGRLRDQLDFKLVVIIVASARDLTEAADGTRTAVDELLLGLRRYFHAGRHGAHRRNVTLAMVVNSGEAILQRNDLLAGLQRIAKRERETLDLVFVNERRLDGQSPGTETRVETNMRMLRLAIDVLANRGAHEALAAEGQKARGRDEPLLLRLAVAQSELAAADRDYAHTIYGALNTVDTERAKAPAGERGEKSAFAETVAERLRASTDVVSLMTRNTDSRLLDPDIQVADDARALTALLALEGLASLPRHEIHRDNQLDSKLRENYVALARRLEKTLVDKLSKQGNALAQAESESVRQRTFHEANLRNGLGLEELGHGNAGLDNHAAAKGKVEAALSDVRSEIKAFWNDHAGSGALPPASDEGLAVLARECPSIDLAWPEVGALASAYNAAQEEISKLPYRPIYPLWALMCSALFLGVPALAGLYWLAAPGRTIEPWGGIVWLLLFGFALTLPFRALRSPRKKVSTALAGVRDREKALYEGVEARLTKVAEYLGQIQRHRFLITLEKHLEALDRELQFVDGYLALVRSSLATDGAVQSLQDVPAGQRSLAEAIRQRGGGDRRRTGRARPSELDLWLDTALRQVRTTSSAEAIRLTLLEGATAQPVQSSLFRGPLEVRVIRYAEPMPYGPGAVREEGRA